MKLMEFIFTCPETNRVFHTSAFDITENNGVRIEADGSRSLDAKVALRDPCPYCSGLHAYPAAELACPFNGQAGAEKGGTNDR
jgi:phosphotransferase system HPr-like phosphotransfer protein